MQLQYEIFIVAELQKCVLPVMYLLLYHTDFYIIADLCSQLHTGTEKNAMRRLCIIIYFRYIQPEPAFLYNNLGATKAFSVRMDRTANATNALAEETYG